MTKDEIYSKAQYWFIGLPKGEKFELSREEILTLLSDFHLHLLQQTPYTTPLEFLEQMLVDAEMKKPANVEPFVLSKAVQKVQALKCVIKMIKDIQPIA